MAALEYLPPGVRAETFRPDPAARRAVRARYGLGDAPLLLSVSRLVARKGQDSLIRALPADPARRSRTCGLLIVGDGPDGPRLRTLVDRLELARHGAASPAAVPWVGPAGALRGRGRLRDAVPDPGVRAGRRGTGHRVPGGVRQRAAGDRRAVRWSARDRPAGSHRAGRRRPGRGAQWPTRPAACSPTPTGPPSGAPTAGPGCSQTWNWDPSADRLADAALGLSVPPRCRSAGRVIQPHRIGDVDHRRCSISCSVNVVGCPD